MLDEIIAPESKGPGTCSHRAQITSDSKSIQPRLCPVCGEVPKRDQDLTRHILDVHLPDWICCPHPDCPWHGSRRESLYKHINSSKKCGPRPKLVEEYKIYDHQLALRYLLAQSVPFETVETFALGWIEERAEELKKVNSWGPSAGWRKFMSQVLVEDVWVAEMK